MMRQQDAFDKHPPRWADKLLEWRCPDHLLEEVQGDLHELFEERVAEGGLKRARRQYLLDVLGIIRPFAFQPRTPSDSTTNRPAMLGHYLTIAFRHLLRQKAFSLLNLLGLAIGMACAGLIFLWVEDEVTFDSVHLKKERLYAVRNNWPYAGQVRTMWSGPALLAPALRREVPGIARTCRTADFQQPVLITAGEQSLYTKGLYADASLFSLFTLPFVQGNARQPFPQLYSIVLTETTARKFFGQAKDVVGKNLRIDQSQNYLVSGVVADPPPNSSVQFEWVMPLNVYFLTRPWQASRWDNNNPVTYLELAPGTDPASVNRQLHRFIQQHDPTSKIHSFLFPMPRWRLYNAFENGQPTGGGRVETVRMLSLIAWIMLLIACTNFMNLSTARAFRRAREVGVRKVLGAARTRLIAQFMGEALSMASLATLLAVLLMGLLLPAFNGLVEKELLLGLHRPLHLLALLLIALVCGLVAGSYPAFYLSSFKPVSVLKGQPPKTGGVAFVRQGLVVLQFTISLVFIIGTLMVYRQLQHVKSRHLGFDKDRLIEVRVQGEGQAKLPVIRQELLRTGLVEQAALADHPTLYEGDNTSRFAWAGKDPLAELNISERRISPEYIATFGMEITQGRDFRPDGGSDSLNVLVTESLAGLMGRKTVLGEIIRDGGRNYRIVGVVRDFVYGNMYGRPDPVIFFCQLPQHTYLVYVRPKAQSDLSQVLAGLESVLKRYSPGYPFEYRFVDEQFNRMFQTERLTGKLAGVFATLTVIISCLGLLGLAAYTAERRTKEIGIRKVLGATVTNLVGLLSWDFLKLVAVSNLIAWPLAGYLLQGWLEQFEYRISLSWGLFALAGLGALGLAWLTIGFQAIRAARANPVKSLRTE